MLSRRIAAAARWQQDRLSDTQFHLTTSPRQGTAILAGKPAQGDGVLNDPLALSLEDSSSQGEQRFISIGMNVFGKLRVVVHAFRGDVVRMISVRKAEPREIRAYEKGI